MSRTPLWILTASFATLAIHAMAFGAAAANVDFAGQIAPIIEQKCIRCHKPGNEKGDFSLTTFQDATASEYVVPGSADESYLLELVAVQLAESHSLRAFCRAVLNSNEFIYVE